MLLWAGVDIGVGAMDSSSLGSVWVWNWCENADWCILTSKVDTCTHDVEKTFALK